MGGAGSGFIHGMSRSKEYRAWINMRRRCRVETCPGYKHYGALGIDVCDDWFYSFDEFFKHIGSAPSKKHVLDRIIPRFGYIPNNVRWVTINVSIYNKIPSIKRQNNLPVGVKRKGNKFISKITINNKSVYLGSFSSAELANEAYIKKCIDTYGFIPDLRVH